MVQEESARLLAMGPAPPPVTGMTAMTERIIDRLMQTGPVTFLNWSPKKQGNRFWWRLRRLGRTIACLGQLLAMGAVRGQRLYIVAGSTSGLYMTGVLASAGRALGYHVYVHHHTYFYIDRYDWRMAWIDRAIGPNGVHVVHCQEMADALRARYGSRRAFEFLMPSIFKLPLGQPRHSPRVPLVIGHLGNLSVAKGLDRVLETHSLLLQRGRPVRLVLAGPFYTREARQLVDQALANYGECISYLGPVFGPAKSDFFASIDCFLLPSRSESWGIVLDEAMSCGVPVIASRHGCTATLVDNGAGLVVDDDEYVQLAAKQIESWMDNYEQYRRASSAAVEQADALHREGGIQLDCFAERMFSPLGATFVSAS
jgi:glycosyltransferase involved in cell wall biosynthesis